jgi:hypothetical protein
MTEFSLFVERLCDLVDPLSAGVCAGLLAVVVLAINVLFRPWLSARQMSLFSEPAAIP